jgi:hypothetical protein
MDVSTGSVENGSCPGDFDYQIESGRTLALASATVNRTAGPWTGALAYRRALLL